MNSTYDKLMKCYDSIRKKTDFKPAVALVLGSGLGNYADDIKIEETIDYHDIDGFPVSTAPGHKGRFLLGYVGEVPVICMQGRIHYYEGYSVSDVVLPTRLMKLMGAQILYLTNAAGGVNTSFKPGDFMMIRDQISSLVPSPLIGVNIGELGPRFCDMSDIYDKKLRDLISATAKRLDISLQEGVYMQFTGPAYESPQEVKMAGILGADAVGMSTAVEAVAANHMGMHICGISCITNMAAGISKQPLSHEEVQMVADKRAPEFKKLITETILDMNDLIRYID